MENSTRETTGAEQKGLAFAFLTALISGISVFMNGIAVKLTDASAYTIMKNIGALIFIAAIIFAFSEIRHFRNLSRRQWAMLLLIGIVGGSVPFLMFFEGLKMEGAAVSSFIYRSLFLFAGVFGYLILSERPEPKHVAAAFAILCGNALLVSGQITFGTGQLLVLGATVLWALEYAISRKLLIDVSPNANITPRVVMVSRLFFGSIALLALLAWQGGLSSLISPSAMSATVLEWLVVTSLLLAFFMSSWYNALKRLPLLKAAAVLSIGGIVTAALELLFHGKAILPLQAFGLALVLGGAVAMVGFADALGSISTLRKTAKELIC